MQSTAATGRIMAKTGGLDHVRALSGFATTAGGERVVFSIFDNNNPQGGRDRAAAIDSVALAMIETLGVKLPPPASHKKKK
jgi:D-alanyl-D-alanine carboxypeptidase/D-alanyl-D-alanine-endopeptidase (penicillin-binding protein 4)